MLENVVEVILLLFVTVLWFACVERVVRLRLRHQHMVPWGVGAAVVALLPLGLLLLNLFATQPEELPANQLGPALVADNVVKAGMLIWSAGALLLLARAKPADLGLRLGKILSDIGYGVAAFVAVAPVVFGLLTLLEWLLTDENVEPQAIIEALKAQQPVWVWLVAFVSVVIVAPVVEEFLFRVVLQGWFERLELKFLFDRGQWHPQAEAAEDGDSDGKSEPGLEQPAEGGEEEPSPVDGAGTQEGGLGSPPADPYRSPRRQITQEYSQTQEGRDAEAGTSSTNSFALPKHGVFGTPRGLVPLLVSSLIFAAVHAPAWPAPIGLFVFSLVLGYLYRQTHRLWPSMVAHLCLNLFSFVGILVQSFVQEAG